MCDHNSSAGSIWPIADDVGASRRSILNCSPSGRASKASVDAIPVVIVGVFAKETPKMKLGEYDHVDEEPGRGLVRERFAKRLADPGRCCVLHDGDHVAILKDQGHVVLTESRAHFRVA